MDEKLITRLRRRFFQMDRQERHFTHRHLLDVMRQMKDAKHSANATHAGTRVSRDHIVRLKLLADERATTVCALIRLAITEFLQQEGHDANHNEQEDYDGGSAADSTRVSAANVQHAVSSERDGNHYVQ